MQFNQRCTKDLRLTELYIMATARQRGLGRIEPVRIAVAERDGKISITQDQG